MKRTVVSLARALSKFRYCSPAKAMDLIAGGHVHVDRQVITNPSQRIDLERNVIRVKGTDHLPLQSYVYIPLNKPWVYLVTRFDHQTRPTVFELIFHPHASHLVAIGRFDKASEGMLLLTTDTIRAVRVSQPENNIPKVYHVQIRGILTR